MAEPSSYPDLSGSRSGPERRARAGVDRERRLTVSAARTIDEDRGIVRLDPDDMARLGLSVGDLVAIVGSVDRETITYTHARILPAFPEDRGRDLIRMDRIQCANAGAASGQQVLVRPARASDAVRIQLAALTGDAEPATGSLESLVRALENMPMTAGDQVRIRMTSGRSRTFTIEGTEPKGPVVVRAGTRIRIGGERAAKAGAPAEATYSTIAGLDRELARVREMIELPLRRPDLFARLGVAAPKGVLLTGPPGSGKTLIARAVAQEAEAAFLTVNGPEIVDKFYGASEAQLREVFEKARAKAPAIIFIDEIDAIAPKREDLGGDRQVERRIVAQLLTLMDGLEARGNVVVIAATNLAHMLDPALRRPGRFDREITIPVPDRHARRAILDVHSRAMPLEDSVDLAQLAAATHGYVGADLEALTREAGMAALRRFLDGDDDRPAEELTVSMEDFRCALADIAPSAIREVFTEVPTVRWDDVGGLDGAKQTLIEAVEWPLRFEGAYAAAGLRPPRGVLLSGPPGTGKTLLAKALASEAQVNFISIRGPQILSMYVGESERAMRDVFRKARMAAPCILFFDEIDAIAGTRGEGEPGSSQTTERLVAQLLVEMDGVDEMTGVLVLAATNRRDRIDPALLRPGRFDVILDLHGPDRRAREVILRIHLRNRPLADTVDCEALAEATAGFSGAQLEGLCRRAALLALREHLAGAQDGAETPLLLTDRHFDEALADDQGSVDRAQHRTVDRDEDRGIAP
ncbi:MAG: AAA family ATPase [Alphaproteobacteria bacterium]